jgi:hypothetical protein
LKKLLLFILIFLCSHAGAQDSIGAKPAVKKEISIYSEKDIVIDNQNITSKNFDKNFKEKYKDTPFIYEYKTPAKNAWDRFWDWVGELFSSLFRFGANGVAGSFVGIVFKIIMFTIIIFVIYLIAKAILNQEGQWVFGKNSSKKIIDYTDVEKNIHTTDFEKLIKNSLAANENRLAIRYYYLYLLKNMAHKELIVWDIEKTNSDYLYEIKKPATKSHFEYLSYLYNYIWYGEFDLDQESFEKAKTAFEKGIKTIGDE